jgi:AraC-like DNA-binding protein
MTGNDGDRREANEAPVDRLPSFSFELPPSEDGASFAVYRQNSASLCAITLPEGASASDFWFSSTIYQLPHGMIFRASSAAHNMRRGPEQMAGGRNNEIMMIAQVSGQVNTTTGKQRHALGPGDIAFYDYARGYESVATDFSMMALVIARDQVPPLFLTPAVHCAVLPAQAGATRLLFRTIETLLEIADSLTLAEADVAIDAAFMMAGGALQTTLTRAGEASFSDDALMDRALAFIDQNVMDPDLTPSRFEAHLALSRSSLYRLFEPHGGVGAVVLRRRLDRSMKAMLTTVTTKPSLPKLVANYGFRSETHFSRAFRARFGVTPRAFHDMVRRKDHAELAAQAQRAGFASLQAWLDFVSGAPAGARHGRI